MREGITVLVPVFEGAAFVPETLRAIAAQTLAPSRVLVSVDPGADDSLETCRRFARGDGRFEVVEQTTRRGWVGNSNWLLDQVDTEYSCLIPHDDLPAPPYVERLRAALDAQPLAAAAYSDLRGFGEFDGVLAESGIHGTLLSRLVTYLLGHHWGVAYRALTRTTASRAAGPIPSNPFNDFAADTVRVFSLLMQGELVRVPSVLYEKRYRPGQGGQAPWQQWSRERVLAAWTAHCGELGALVARLRFPAAERRVLWEALLFRLLWMRRIAGPFLGAAELSAVERRQQRAALRAILSRPGGLVAP